MKGIQKAIKNRRLLLKPQSINGANGQQVARRGSDKDLIGFLHLLRREIALDHIEARNGNLLEEHRPGDSGKAS